MKVAATEENMAYNDFQKDLIQLSQKVDAKMGNTLKEVEAKIKAIEIGTGTSGKNRSLELMSKSLNQCFWINMGTTDSIDNSIFSKKENLLYAFTNKQLS